MSSEQQQRRTVIALALRLSTAIVLPLLVFLLLGRLADRYFATTPLFLIIGLVLAFVLTMSYLAYTVLTVAKQQR